MAPFEVRPCRRDDLPRVVELLLTGGAARPGVGADEIAAYASSVYFDSPWARDDVASLVTEDARGRIEGFVGVTPRPMRLGDAALVAAIPGNFVVRPGPDGKVNAFAALAMLKRLFSGPQDLTFTDTANEASRRLWEAAGAVNPGLYSLDWFRPIKPATAILQMLETARGAPAPLSRLAHAGAGLADVAGAPVLARMARNKTAAFETAPLAPDRLMTLLNGRDRRSPLTGAYEAADLAWLLAMVEAKAKGARLHRALVSDDQGAAAGAYMFRVRADGFAEALALVTREGRAELVMQAAVADASAAGASVLSGAVQPRMMTAYKDQRCFMMCNRWTLVHSRRAEVLDAFHRGGARLTTLDGERWTRFGDLFGI